MATITQHYDIKCGSAQDYKHALGDTGDGPCPGLEPGTRVLREDGNVYIVTADSFCLKTIDGVYVHPMTLDIPKNQRAAEVFAEMTLT